MAAEETFEDVCVSPQHGHLDEEKDGDWLTAITDKQPDRVQEILDAASR